MSEQATVCAGCAQGPWNGTGRCTCGHDHGVHHSYINDDGHCTGKDCNCRRFIDRDPSVTFR